MLDRLADRWRTLIDRRDELLRLGRNSAARRIDAEVTRIRSRMARILCRRTGTAGESRLGAGGRSDRRPASGYLACA
jgi:hypothetical protein